MNNFEKIQSLLNEKANYKARLKLLSVDGNVEVKTVNNEKYIYLRKREAGRNTSTYIDKYSDELFQLLYREAQEARTLKKNIRKIEKELAILGHTENNHSAEVILNIDFARANIKTLIYDQAVLEGISTTFPQTETILENGKINGVTASDVQKILNLKHAWEFVLDKDVLMSPSNFYVLSYIAKLVNEGFYENGGTPRGVPVRIGGSSYVPQLPLESDVKEKIKTIIEQNKKAIDIAIDLCLYCMKAQIFIDGNKRASIIFTNHYLISKGEGLLVVPESHVKEFKKLLVNYYEDKDELMIREFMINNCWRTY